MAATISKVCRVKIFPDCKNTYHSDCALLYDFLLQNTYKHQRLFESYSKPRFSAMQRRFNL